MVRQLYLYSIEAADFPDSVTSENTLREFPLVIATVAKVSRKQRTLARCPRKKKKDRLHMFYMYSVFLYS